MVWVCDKHGYGVNAVGCTECLRQEINWLRVFITRVYAECDRDIRCTDLPVPGDSCLWSLRAEAKKLLEEHGAHPTVPSKRSE